MHVKLKKERQQRKQNLFSIEQEKCLEILIVNFDFEIVQHLVANVLLQHRTVLFRVRLFA